MLKPKASALGFYDFGIPSSSFGILSSFVILVSSLQWPHPRKAFGGKPAPHILVSF
jgi:hypothetical protein